MEPDLYDLWCSSLNGSWNAHSYKFKRLSVLKASQVSSLVHWTAWQHRARKWKRILRNACDVMMCPSISLLILPLPRKWNMTRHSETKGSLLHLVAVKTADVLQGQAFGVKDLEAICKDRYLVILKPFRQSRLHQCAELFEPGQNQWTGVINLCILSFEKLKHQNWKNIRIRGNLQQQESTNLIIWTRHSSFPFLFSSTLSIAICTCCTLRLLPECSNSTTIINSNQISTQSFGPFGEGAHCAMIRIRGLLLSWIHSQQPHAFPCEAQTTLNNGQPPRNLDYADCSLVSPAQWHQCFHFCPCRSGRRPPVWSTREKEKNLSQLVHWLNILQTYRYAHYYRRQKLRDRIAPQVNFFL